MGTPLFPLQADRSANVHSAADRRAAARLRAMRQDPPDVLVGDVDLNDRIAALLERDIVEIAVRRDEDFRVPDEALGVGNICNL